MNSRQNQLQAFERLLDIMDDLRENVRGIRSKPCKRCVILPEETYELGDAIWTMI
jgi:XTP/dITP diphosphohydrolase